MALPKVTIPTPIIAAQMMMSRADRRGMKKPLAPKTITKIDKLISINIPRKNLAMVSIPDEIAPKRPSRESQHGEVERPSDAGQCAAPQAGNVHPHT
jgi:hypothetical protein